MLDVAIMGIIVVTCAGTAYHKEGVMFSVMAGLWVLLLAEAFHYFIHFQVHSAYNSLTQAKAKAFVQKMYFSLLREGWEPNEAAAQAILQAAGQQGQQVAPAPCSGQTLA
eukprot:g14830.t1